VVTDSCKTKCNKEISSPNAGVEIGDLGRGRKKVGSRVSCIALPPLALSPQPSPARRPARTAAAQPCLQPPNTPLCCAAPGSLPDLCGRSLPGSNWGQVREGGTRRLGRKGAWALWHSRAGTCNSPRGARARKRQLRTCRKSRGTGGSAAIGIGAPRSPCAARPWRSGGQPTCGCILHRIPAEDGEAGARLEAVLAVELGFLCHDEAIVPHFHPAGGVGFCMFL
jgi:hypothetical protein